MNAKQRLHAAKVLLGATELLGDDKWLPKVFVVDGHCYWFLNAARRAAYDVHVNIEVLTIREAWEIVNKEPWPITNKNRVDWAFDQTGETFNGYLFDHSYKVMANELPGETIHSEDTKDSEYFTERKRIIRALKMSRGVKAKAAVILGMKIYQFNSKLFDLQINPKDYGKDVQTK